MDRRKFLSSVGAAGAVSLLPLSSEALTLSSEANPILKAGPYLQVPRPNQITVRWITNKPCYSWVEFGLSSGLLDKKAEIIDDGLTEAYNTINAITLDNLEPGKQYYYRILSKEFVSFEPYKIVYGETYQSEVYSFSTPKPGAESVSFLIFNDIHDRPASFPHLMQYAGNEKRDFVFLNGDMFDYQADENQLVDHLLEPLSKLFSPGTPFLLSRGNHETRGKFARNISDYFDGYGKKFYYSFQYGPMYAIVLDSGEDKPDDTEVYAGIVNFDNYRMEQARWLEKEIQKKEFRQAKYKVVFSHIPFFYASDWHGTLHCRKLWNPILNKAKVDVLISGHTHTYGIHPKVEGEHHYPIVIGGGPRQGKRTIIKVKADKNSFNLDMLDDKGNLVGNLKL